jgi:hypothetical protein
MQRISPVRFGGVSLAIPSGNTSRNTGSDAGLVRKVACMAKKILGAPHAWGPDTGSRACVGIRVLMTRILGSPREGPSFYDDKEA